MKNLFKNKTKQNKTKQNKTKQNKYLFILLFCLICQISFAQEIPPKQEKSNRVHELGLSVPVLWNSSQGVYYTLGSRKEPSGEALSYGINLHYSKSIYKNIFGTVGIGYFNQAFGIERKIDYDAGELKPLIWSKSYAYNSFHFFAGLGYKQSLGQKFALKGQATYNLYHSFRQRYTPTTTAFGGNQINKNSLNIGRMFNLHIDVERKLSKKLSIGLGLIVPVMVEWENDKMFFELLGYANDENKIAYNKFSIGTNLCCNYNF
jgi:hypothetical protein